MTADELRTICTAAGFTVSIAGLMREEAVAELLDVSVRTLRTWRTSGEGPPCVRMGGTWRYPIDDLAAFMSPA